MRRFSLLVVALFAIGLLPVSVEAAMCRAVSGTNWSTATWSCGGPPTATDTVEIGAAVNLNLDVDATVAGLATEQPFPVQTLSLTIPAGRTLTVNGPINWRTAGNAAALNVNGTLIAQSMTINSDTAGAPTSLNVNGGLAELINGLTFAGTTFGNDLSITANGTLRLGGNLPAGGDVSATGGTVEFNAASGNQTVAGYALGNLVINKATGSLLTSAGTSVAGDLSVNGDLNIGGNTLVVSGDVTNNGTITATTGSFGVSSVGSLSGAGQYANLSIGGTRTFNAGSHTIIGNVTVGAGALAENNGQVTIGGNLIGIATVAAATWNNNVSSALIVGGTLFATGGTLNATANPNLVEYKSASPVTIYNTTYHDLTIAGAGVKNALSTVAVNGNLTVSAGGTFAPGVPVNVTGNVQIDGTLTLNASMGVGGNWTKNGTFNPGTSIVDFNGSSIQQQIGASNFHHVTFSNFVDKQINGALTISGDLTVAAGSTFGTTAAVTHTIAGNWINDGFYNYGTSNILFNGGTQSLKGGFFDVTLAGTGTKSLAGVTSITGDLTIGSGVTLAPGTNFLEVWGSFLNNGNFTPSPGQTTRVGHSIILARRNINPSALGITSIGGSSTTTFQNLDIENGFGPILQTTPIVIVSGTLALDEGEYQTGANVLIANGTVTRNLGHVFGRFQKPFAGAGVKTFELGAGGLYGPVDVNVVSGAGNVIVTSYGTAHPNAANPANTVQRYWNINAPAITASLTMTYPSTAAGAGVETNYVVGLFNGASWSYPGATVNAAGDSANVAATSTFGDFAIGEQVALGGAAASFTITAASTTQTAGTQNNLTITARDAGGLVATTYTGDHNLIFSGASNGLNGSVPSVTDKNGTAILFGSTTTITFTNGVATVSAGLNGALTLFRAETANIAVTDGSISTATPLSITVTAAAINNFAVALTSPQASGVNFTGANTVTARDQFNNTITTFNASTTPVTMSTTLSGTITGLGSGNNAIMNQAGDFVSGVANLTALGMRYTGLSGTGTFTATAGAAAGTSNSITVNGGPAVRLIVIAPGESFTPGVAPGKSGAPISQTSNVAFDVVVAAVDASYNLAPTSDVVSLSSSDASATLPPDTALTGGDAQLTLTLRTAGTQSITANDVTAPAVTAGSVNVTLVEGPLANFLVEAASGGAIAPQTAGTPFNIRITARDAAGNTVTSFNGTVTLTSNATLAGAPLTSGAFVNGVLASQSVTINSAQGGTTITATNGAASGTSAPFTVNAGGTGSFLVQNPGGGNIPTQTAGVAFNIEIRALDAFGNLNTNYTGTVALTTSAGTISPTSTTFTGTDAGIKIVSVTVTQAGSAQTITVTDASLPASGMSNGFVVVGGPVASFEVLNDAGGAIGDHVVDEAFGIKVVARDAFGNIATSFNGTVNITSTGDLGTGGGTTASFVNGVLVHTVSFTQSGAFTITATNTAGTETGTSNSFNIVPGCATSMTQALPANGAGGQPQSISFYWNGVPGATTYRLFIGKNGATPSLAGTTPLTTLTVAVGLGSFNWYVEAQIPNCPVVRSATWTFSTATGCEGAGTPLASAPGTVTSNEKYTVEWPALSGVSSYQIQEATSDSFLGALSQTINTTSMTFQHPATSTPVPYYYRVRAVASCNGSIGEFSKTVRVVVLPPPPATEPNPDVTTPLGSTKPIVQQLFIPGSNTTGKALDTGFTATTDKSWLTVSPASGSIPPQGTTVTVTANPTGIPAGTSTGTVNVTSTTTGTSIASVPVSINIVTAVTPVAKSGAIAQSLIVPSVGHLSGQNSHWQSDIRISNVSTTKQRYLLAFTPSGVDATKEGKQTIVELERGQTMAFDDIVKRWYGLGALADGSNGVLEIRPMSTSKTSAIEVGKATVASSRTYNVTANGTLGQFIPAISYSQFVGKLNAASQPVKLSLQQIANSSAYRTNIGLVEASGEPATVQLTFFNANNQQVFQTSVTLKPGEHQQLNNILGLNNISLVDGRVEAAVTSTTGRVTAYASVVDNATNDPLLVSAKVLPGDGAARYVVPGVADLDTGAARWRTDMRVYNASDASVDATLTFYPRGNPSASKSAVITLAPHAIRQIDDMVKELFGDTNTSGSVAITTATNTELVVTARTYNQTSNGTYGQYIPAVTPQEAIGVGSAPLQILQIEESARFRTNIGVAEVSGQAATVEVTVLDSEAKAAPVMRFDLQPNEYRQIDGIVRQLNLGNVYNGRVTVTVIGGTGRVTAYGSIVDNQTQDPTYVPAQ